jgi:hypothetical protein
MAFSRWLEYVERLKKADQESHFFRKLRLIVNFALRQEIFRLYSWRKRGSRGWNLQSSRARRLIV